MSHMNTSDNGVLNMVVDPASVGLPPLPIPQDVPNPSVTQVILPLEEFAEDLDLRLGRANGNVFQRRPGVEGCHDGQVMIRLKKKRFIVIDYSIVPNEHDLQASAMNVHINVPLGAGVTKCNGKIHQIGPAPPGLSTEGGDAPTTSPPVHLQGFQKNTVVTQCHKVGVPVLLYDSEPNEPASLYLRSGLCFKCQRNLNEKRRTQRKKPADRAAASAAKAASKNQIQVTAEHSQAAFLAAASHNNTLVGTQAQQQQQQQAQFALSAAGAGNNGTTMTHHHQTVQIGGMGSQTVLVGGGSTGRVNSTPHHRVLMAVTNGHKKIKLAQSNQPLVLAPDAIILNGPPDNHSCKSVRTGHGFAEIGVDLQVETHQSLNAVQTLLHSVGANEMIQGISPPTPEDISRQYDNAFYSLSKSLYLLVQWKTSWDSAISAAVAQEAAASEQANAVHAVVMGAQHAAATAASANAAATAAIGMPGMNMSHVHQHNPNMHNVAHHQNMHAAVATSSAGAGAVPNGGTNGSSVPSSPGGAGVGSLAQAVASAAAVAAATTNTSTSNTTPNGTTSTTAGHVHPRDADPDTDPHVQYQTAVKQEAPNMASSSVQAAAGEGAAVAQQPEDDSAVEV